MTGRHATPARLSREQISAMRDCLRENAWDLFIFSPGDRFTREQGQEFIDRLCDMALVAFSESAPTAYQAVGYVKSLDGCTSTHYEKGRVPDGESMLYIVARRK